MEKFGSTIELVPDLLKKECKAYYTRRTKYDCPDMDSQWIVTVPSACSDYPRLRFYPGRTLKEALDYLDHFTEKEVRCIVLPWGMKNV